MKVPFVDLTASLAPIRHEIREAIDRVMDDTSFILGPEVTDFEERFARDVDRRHCIGLNSGTSALHLALLCAGVGPGDEVVTTPHTFIATSWAISYVGATPVYADVDHSTGNLDPAAAEQVITSRTKALIVVDLYGNPAALDEFEALAQRHGLTLIEDAAQAHSATLAGRSTGSFGHSACFSFYPSKNLGALGEAGAVVTDDDSVAARMRSLRDHAQDGKHHHSELGYNFRMEGIQGAVLGVKLRHLAAWTAGRRAAAARYDDLLSGLERVTAPVPTAGADPAWHLYVIRVEDRARVSRLLAEDGVGTGVHYPTPTHLQPAYAHLGYRPGSLPRAEAFMATCLSLPMYAELEPSAQEYVVERLRSAVGG